MMMFHAVGDLAQSLSLRRQSASAQSDVMRLTQEMSSGEVAHVSEHLQGSFGQLADMENRLAVNEPRRMAGAEAATQAATMQGALELIQNRLTDLSDRAMVVSQASEGPALASLGRSANQTLGTIISALNVEVAGRPVFAGSSLNAAPLASAADTMAAARSAVSGAVDAAGVRAALDTFFDMAGGGFETVIYQGGTADLTAFRLGEGEEVVLAIRADDPKVRAILKDTVMAALAADESLALDGAERVSLMRDAGAAMRAGLDQLVGLRANLGFAEERIGHSISRNAAEHSALKMARSDLLAVDLFETASALEQAQLRLETIYTLTARTARLNLVNFL